MMEQRRAGVGMGYGRQENGPESRARAGICGGQYSSRGGESYGGVEQFGDGAGRWGSI